MARTILGPTAQLNSTQLNSAQQHKVKKSQYVLRDIAGINLCGGTSININASISIPTLCQSALYGARQHLPRASPHFVLYLWTVKVGFALWVHRGDLV